MLLPAPRHGTEFRAVASSQCMAQQRASAQCKSVLNACVRFSCTASWMPGQMGVDYVKNVNMLWVFEAYPFFWMPSRDRITNLLMRICFPSSGHFEMFTRKPFFSFMPEVTLEENIFIQQ